MEQTVERVVPRLRLQLNWRLVGMMLAVKVAVLIAGGLVVQLLGNQRLPTLRSWLVIWNAWDAPHYLDLAAYGYQNSGELRLFLVFYPLYPWLIRLAGWPFGDYLLGAFIVSTIASLIMGVLMYRLVSLDEPPGVAYRSVWFLFILPTAYFLHIGYTESLFLALAFGCLLAARQQQWWLAGLLGAAASLTRVNGLLLLPVLLVEALHQFSFTRRWHWQWLWSGAVVLGFAAYLLLNYRVTGDPFAFSKIVEQHWYKSLTWPWVGIKATITSVATRKPVTVWGIFVPELVFIILSFLATLICAFKLRPAYTVWMALNWLLFTSTSFILSVPRYTLLLFPIAILLARAGQRRLWLGLLSLISIAGLVLFASLFLLKLGGY